MIYLKLFCPRYVEQAVPAGPASALSTAAVRGWLSEELAIRPALLKETGTAPNCEDTGKMLGVQGGGKRNSGRSCKKRSLR